MTTAANRDPAAPLRRPPAASAPDVSPTADRELVAVRVFDAPRPLVFQAWTDPAHIANWWGPRGFTTTTYAMDVRPGGVWRFCMHGPDGRDYQNKITSSRSSSPSGSSTTTAATSRSSSRLSR